MNLLINKKCKLERYPGKGGWTYTRIPQVVKNKMKSFGWVKVRGTIDGVEIKKYHLMPMGDGNLFLPVKAEIRKKIGKEAGDWITVVLYPDTDPLIVPDEMLLCLKDEPDAFRFFNTLSESERRFYIDWVYSAKKAETKSNRMAKTIDRLARGLKLYHKEM